MIKWFPHSAVCNECIGFLGCWCISIRAHGPLYPGFSAHVISLFPTAPVKSIPKSQGGTGRGAGLATGHFVSSQYSLGSEHSQLEPLKRPMCGACHRSLSLPLSTRVLQDHGEPSLCLDVHIKRALLLNVDFNLIDAFHVFIKS